MGGQGADIVMVAGYYFLIVSFSCFFLTVFRDCRVPMKTKSRMQSKIYIPSYTGGARFARALIPLREAARVETPNDRAQHLCLWLFWKWYSTIICYLGQEDVEEGLITCRSGREYRHTGKLWPVRCTLPDFMPVSECNVKILHN